MSGMRRKALPVAFALLIVALPKMVRAGEPLVLTIQPSHDLDRRVFYMLFYNDSVAELFNRKESSR